jgi:micrococcal nuclease
MSECIVASIIDGDTIICREIGRVRLIGIDSPEMDQRPFGAMAAAALSSVLPLGTRVSLELDSSPHDRYGRLLAYVWKDGSQLNLWMVREGWAIAVRYPPNLRYAAVLDSASYHASKKRWGLWAKDAFNCMPSERRKRYC